MLYDVEEILEILDYFHTKHVVPNFDQYGNVKENNSFPFSPVKMHLIKALHDGLIMFSNQNPVNEVELSVIEIGLLEEVKKRLDNALV